MKNLNIAGRGRRTTSWLGALFTDSAGAPPLAAQSLSQYHNPWRTLPTMAMTMTSVRAVSRNGWSNITALEITFTPTITNKLTRTTRWTHKLFFLRFHFLSPLPILPALSAQIAQQAQREFGTSPEGARRQPAVPLLAPPPWKSGTTRAPAGRTASRTARTPSSRSAAPEPGQWTPSHPAYGLYEVKLRINYNVFKCKSLRSYLTTFWWRQFTVNSNLAFIQTWTRLPRLP